MKAVLIVIAALCIPALALCGTYGNTQIPSRGSWTFDYANATLSSGTASVYSVGGVLWTRIFLNTFAKNSSYINLQLFLDGYTVMNVYLDPGAAMCQDILFDSLYVAKQVDADTVCVGGLR